MCWVFGLFYWLPQKVEFLTIATVSIHRLVNLMFPLSTRGLKSARATMKLCAVIWLFVAAAIVLDIYLKIPIKFDMASSTCGVFYEFEHMNHNQAALEALWLVTTCSLIVFPLVATIAVNIAILVLAGLYRFRHTGNRVPSKNAFLTVSLVAWSFVCSTVPALVMYIVIIGDGADNVSVTGIIIAWECLTISMWINPFIYTVINNRFRKFLSDAVSKSLGDLRKSCNTSLASVRA